MSNTMLMGVLRMPPDLWSNDDLYKYQRHTRYLQAADRIEFLEKIIDEALSFEGTPTIHRILEKAHDGN